MADAPHHCTDSRWPCPDLCWLCARTSTLWRPSLSPTRHEDRTPAVSAMQFPPRPSIPPPQTFPSPAECPGASRVPYRCFHTPAPLESAPRRPISAFSGATPPRERVSGDPAPPPAPPTVLGRQIRMQRPGLDLGSSQLEPSDLDPAARNRAYRFGLDFFLKSPSLYC